MTINWTSLLWLWVLEGGPVSLPLPPPGDGLKRCLRPCNGSVSASMSLSGAAVQRK